MVTNDMDENGLQDLGRLPVPIQTFLWRQIAAFVRPKLGKLHEANCMELKEACKSFEKVLVQNIHFGLSPSLTSALQSTPRWRVVQAALPHVMHCASALLTNRVKDLQNLGAAETKLLYTLHWIFLFAADECADNEDGKKEMNPYDYLFSIPTISLFVYLFAPIAHHLKESDFQNFRLENGIKLWQGMWEYRSPNIQCFMAPVKPKARQFLQQTSTTTPQSNENVFIGKTQQEQHHESPTNTSFSETPKHDDDISSMCIASPKEPVFPETIPEEASSIEEEHVLLFRLPHGPDPIFYTADASLLHQSHYHQSRRSSKGSLQSKDRFHDKHTTKFDFDKIESFEKKHDETHKAKGSSSTERESVDTDIKSPQYQKAEQKTFSRQSPYDISAATFLDVAVLRCLFVSHWQEEGIFWGLHYLYNR
ncbi:hypothetical protein PVAND_000797 [Polypedilum vanderplanki]|uniref:Cation channel complex component UNC80 N-terminal domain-containing protein n=1 Tax=Polypedilum vanderplanki TaxID=319348 RepID=A0A9J6BMC3_POLVA|nr:hypothetical protein PVAND_000797 [Polypedilum vanderplanki]